MLRILERGGVSGELVKSNDRQHLIRRLVRARSNLCGHLRKPKIILLVDRHPVQSRDKSFDKEAKRRVTAQLEIGHEAIEGAALGEHMVRRLLVGVPDHTVFIEERQKKSPDALLAPHHFRSCRHHLPSENQRFEESGARVAEIPHIVT